MTTFDTRTPEAKARSYCALTLKAKTDELLRRMSDCRDKSVSRCTDIVQELADAAGVENRKVMTPHAENVLRRLVWALLEDKAGVRSERSQVLTEGTVKELLAAATVVLFE